MQLDKSDWQKIARSFVLGVTGIMSALGYVWFSGEENQAIMITVIASFGPVLVQFIKKLVNEGDDS
jgi:hypothetical protein